MLVCNMCMLLIMEPNCVLPPIFEVVVICVEDDDARDSTLSCFIFIAF